MRQETPLLCESSWIPSKKSSFWQKIFSQMLQLQNKITNNRGESLITVMIAIGLIAIVTSAALSMYSNLMRQQKTVMVKGAMQN
ncbi:MAG: hypothetical protein AAGB31_14695, partial [Bdellovibrio sp.]